MIPWDEYRAFAKEQDRARRAANTRRNVEELRENRIEYRCLDGLRHLSVGRFDYWPSTGRWWNRVTGERGCGGFIDQYRKVYS